MCVYDVFLLLFVPQGGSTLAKYRTNGTVHELCNIYIYIIYACIYDIGLAQS